MNDPRDFKVRDAILQSVIFGGLWLVMISLQGYMAAATNNASTVILHRIDTLENLQTRQHNLIIDDLKHIKAFVEVHTARQEIRDVLEKTNNPNANLLLKELKYGGPNASNSSTDNQADK